MSDYRWTPIGEPHFPDGPVLHLFDDYPQAHATLGRDLPLNRHLSADGKLFAAWMSADADTIMGLNPSFVVDHTTRAWPDEWVTLVALRAGRANAQVARAEDVVKALGEGSPSLRMTATEVRERNARAAFVRELERRERRATEGADFAISKVAGPMDPEIEAFVRTVSIRAAYQALCRELDGPVWQLQTSLLSGSDIPCDTGAQEAAPGVKAPDQPR